MAENEKREIAEVDGNTLSLKQVTDRVNLVHKVLEKVMKKGTHYGTVPGCGPKLVLLKPGADVLAMTFRLVPQFNVATEDLAFGHKQFTVTCSMCGPGGVLLGQGVGSASTMEKKYRYRWEGEGKERKRIENEDIADTYNTVLKIAKKRAHIDATLTVTGAADLFTQDLIDEDNPPAREPVKMPTEKTVNTVAPLAAGQKVISGVIDAVAVREGESTKGTWKKWGVKIEEIWYATFDTTVGEMAEYLKGNSVRIVYTTNAKGYHDIVSLEPIKPDEPQPEMAGATKTDDVPMGTPEAEATTPESKSVADPLELERQAAVKALRMLQKAKPRAFEKAMQGIKFDGALEAMSLDMATELLDSLRDGIGK